MPAIKMYKLICDRCSKEDTVEADHGIDAANKLDWAYVGRVGDRKYYCKQCKEEYEKWMGSD